MSALLKAGVFPFLGGWFWKPPLVLVTVIPWISWFFNVFPVLYIPFVMDRWIY